MSANGELILKNIWNSKQIVFLFGLMGAMIFFVVSALIPPSYKAVASIAVNQTRTGGLDAYREAKSSEFIAQTIKEMIMANSFMNEVNSNGEIVWQEMREKKSQDEKIKLWKKKIKISVVPNTGVVHIAVYTKNRLLSQQIAFEIINILQNKKITFFNNKGVKLEIIDQPYYFYKPAFPNLFLNTVVGCIIGSVVAINLIIKNTKISPVVNFGFKKNNIKYAKLSSKDLNL